MERARGAPVVGMRAGGMVILGRTMSVNHRGRMSMRAADAAATPAKSSTAMAGTHRRRRWERGLWSRTRAAMRASCGPESGSACPMVRTMLPAARSANLA
jgi:hypothetical protein